MKTIKAILIALALFGAAALPACGKKCGKKSTSTSCKKEGKQSKKSKKSCKSCKKCNQSPCTCK